jgi:hypothetical protein
MVSPTYLQRTSKEPATSVLAILGPLHNGRTMMLTTVHPNPCQVTQICLEDSIWDEGFALHRRGKGVRTPCETLTFNSN